MGKLRRLQSEVKEEFVLKNKDQWLCYQQESWVGQFASPDEDWGTFQNTDPESVPQT